MLTCFTLSNVQELGSDSVWGTAAIWEVQLVMSEPSICKSFGIIHLQGMTIRMSNHALKAATVQHLHMLKLTCSHKSLSA